MTREAIHGLAGAAGYQTGDGSYMLGVKGSQGGFTPRVTATMTRPANATQYTAGDIIANSGTAGLVVPLSFQVNRTDQDVCSGRVSGCRAVVAPASSNLVITNLDFDLLLFRPEVGIPFAEGGYPADNAALAVSAAAMRELVAIFSFVNTAWRSPAGSVSVAGVAGYQSVLLSSGRFFAPFNLASINGASTLLGILQAKAAWNPGNIAQQFDFALDLDQD